MSIKWQEPPAPKKRPRKLPDFAGDLRARPGAWALVETKNGKNYANQRAVWMRRNMPGFEFTIRGCDIYARYVGEVS